METGFRCPECGSYANHFIPWTYDDIECDVCHNEFTPADCENDE